MSNPRDDICARDRCHFRPELVLVANMALSASYCSDACADLVWIRGHLAAVEPTSQTLALAADLRDIERTLDARNDPTDVDQILDYSVLIDGELL